MDDLNRRTRQKTVRLSYEEEWTIEEAAEDLGVPVGTYIRNAALEAARAHSHRNTEPIFSHEFASLFCTQIATQLIIGSVQAKGMEKRIAELQMQLMRGLGH